MNNNLNNNENEILDSKSNNDMQNEGQNTKHNTTQNTAQNEKENEIFTKIKEIILVNCPDLVTDELTMSTVINTETAIDSMGFILIICKIEAAFDIRIPDRQWQKASTIGDVVHIVEKKVAR